MNTLCESPPRSSTWPWHPPCGWSRSLQEDDTSFMLAFFDEQLGQLEPHHQFPDLGPRQGQVARLGLGPRPQPTGPRLQEQRFQLSNSWAGTWLSRDTASSAS